MRVRGLWRVRRAVGRLRAYVRPHGVILHYHRVSEVQSDPWALNVTPGHFAEHMEVLRRFGRAARLRELVRGLETARVARRTTVVTFDDGYADNLHNAKPVLERYNVPATVFLTSGYIGHRGEFWWDELEHLLLQPGERPAMLRLTVRGESYRWQLGDAARYEASAARHHRRWLAWGQPDPTLRHTIYREVYELLYPLSDDERREALGAIRTWAGAEPICRPTHRLLSEDEVAALADGNLVEIGSHTVTHPLLAALSPEVQHQEIRCSKARLEDILNRAVPSFAYSFGRQCDYTAETVAGVREAGFTVACSNFPGRVAPGVDRFQLPRMWVYDWDGDEFARRLSEWFGG